MKGVIGHAWASQLLLDGLAAGRVSHATLFSGPPNIGKTTLARAFAMALNCAGQPPLPCGECNACRKAASGNYPDLHILDDPEQPLKIEQIRELLHELALSPYEGRWRVVILCHFERATPEAANALLKTLEEPPPQVVLLLTATEADVLLPTIVSRCQVINLRPLPITDVQRALVEHWSADERQAELLAHLSGGRLGWAVTMLEDPSSLEWRTRILDELLALRGKGRVERLAYAAALSGDERQTRQARQEVSRVLELWLTWWRDVLLLASGSRAPLTNVDRLDSLRQVADQVTLERARQMVAQLQFVLKILDQNVNLRLALDVVLLSMP